MCDTRRVDVAIVPDVLEVAADGSVDVTWPAADAEDGAPRHRSTFTANWLQANAYWSQSTATLQEGPPQLPQRAWVSADFDPSTVDERGFASMVAAVGFGESVAQSRVAAGAGKAMGLPSVAYERVMEEEAGVHEWLELVHHHGFAFVHGVPATMEATEAVSRCVHVRWLVCCTPCPALGVSTPSPSVLVALPSCQAHWIRTGDDVWAYVGDGGVA